MEELLRLDHLRVAPLLLFSHLALKRLGVPLGRLSDKLTEQVLCEDPLALLGLRVGGMVVHVSALNKRERS